MKYKIFADATADLNENLLKGLPQVEVIPMEITLGGKQYRYGLNEELTLEKFYAELHNGKYASTSQINPMTYYEYFSRALEQGYDVLYLCFSSEMSSTFISAEMSIIDLKEDYPDRKIICVDTLGASVGEALLVCEAAQKQAEGMDIDELKKWIEENRLNVCHWFVVDTFKHLKHGGRVSETTAALGTTLNIKPLLHVTTEGNLQVQGKPRGQKMAMKHLLKKLDDGWNPMLGRKIIIGHSYNLERAVELKNYICEKYSHAEVMVADMGAIIGAHTGPGVLALIYWGNNR